MSPAVFMAFEEKTDELVMNVKSLGYDLDKHLANNKIYLEHVQINRDEILETGKYNIEGLFVRLGQAIDKVKANAWCLILWIHFFTASIIKYSVQNLKGFFPG